jgi:hypothetical protein
MGYRGYIYTWQQARDLVESPRRKGRARIARNTWLVRSKWHEPGGYGVLLHGTEIVTIHADGTYAIRALGWRTVTTKDRLSRFAPVYIRSQWGEWWIANSSWRIIAKFEDGMRVDAGGVPVDPNRLADCAQDMEEARRYDRERRNARRRNGRPSRPRADKLTPSELAFRRLRKAKSGADLPDAWNELREWSQSTAGDVRAFFNSCAWVHGIHNAVLDAVTVPAKRAAIRSALELFAPWRALSDDQLAAACALSARLSRSAVAMEGAPID